MIDPIAQRETKSAERKHRYQRQVRHDVWGSQDRNPMCATSGSESCDARLRPASRDELAPLITERPDYRLLITTGRLVANYAVIGQLLPDDTVELLEIEIALQWLPDPEEDQG